MAGFKARLALAFRRLRRARLSSLVTLVSLVSGCVTLVPSERLTQTSIPPTPTTPTDDWETLAPGLERRLYLPSRNSLAQLVALRIDPALYTFRVHYRPGSPLGWRGWREALPDAAAFVNGNFFDPQGNALGMVVADGAAYGASYQGFGGMFQIQDGQARVRSLVVEPFAGEALEQAVQGFPVLVLDGQANYARDNDTDVSRRTVVGQDGSGRIVLLITPLVGMSLPALSAYLPTTDLNLLHALNLDGGGSTMMYVSAGDAPYSLPSFDAVPTVLAVYTRTED